MPDSSWITDRLEVGDVLTDSIFPEGSAEYTSLAVLFGGEGLSGRFAEVPGFDKLSIVGDKESVGGVHESGTTRTTFLVAVPEVLLKLVGVVRSVVGFSGELTILGLSVEIGVGAGCCEDGFNLFFIVPIGDFGKSSEVVFDREFVDDDEFSSLVLERDFPTEDIIVHRTGGIPARTTVPARDGDDIGCKLYFGEGVSFLSEN